jgi:hypothetical protein
MAGKKRPPVSEEPAVADEEEAFPRGGRDDLTPLEKRQLSQQAEADFQREQQTDADGKKQKKKAKLSGDQVRFTRLLTALQRMLQKWRSHCLLWGGTYPCL